MMIEVMPRTEIRPAHACCNIKLAFRCFLRRYLLQHNGECRGTRTQRGSIHRHNFLSRTVYFCPVGYAPIGYDHVVKDDDDFSAGIDEAQAEEPLRQDAQIAVRAVLRLINVFL